MLIEYFQNALTRMHTNNDTSLYLSLLKLIEMENQIDPQQQECTVE